MIQHLLDEVISISHNENTPNKEGNENVNIFEITGFDHDKVKICKVLYELLSPHGGQRKKFVYLKLFFEDALHLDISQEELQAAKIYKNYLIDKNRKIDLVIKTPQRQIPIDVKINSSAENSQHVDYLKEAVNSNVFCLNLNGNIAKEQNTDNLDFSRISYISFEQDILNWLGRCLIEEDTQKNVLIREVLKQFIVAICHITDRTQVERRKKIVETLVASPANLRSAVEISNCIDEAKQRLIRCLFQAVEEKVDETKIENEYDYKYNPDTIDSFYRHRQSECPGISYKFKDNVKPDTDIWVRIEIESFSGYNSLIYAGYYCTSQGQKGEKLLSNSEIEDILSVPPWVDRWWAYYEYLPVDDMDKCPNFRDFNESYFKLLDDEYFDEFTTKCAEKVKELLGK